MKNAHKTIKEIHCFGNPDLEDDRSALDIADILSKESALKNFQFIKCTSPDFLLNEDIPDPLIIIDVVKGIDEIKVIRNLDLLKTSASTTLHDFDLGKTLKLLTSLDRLGKVFVIGIPYGKKIKKNDIKKITQLLSLNIPFKEV